MKTLKSSEDKFIIFTDIHFGNNKDSEIFLNENDKVIDWIIETCKSKGVKNVIFGGDFFHKEEAVDTGTHNRGYDAVKRMVSEGLTIYFIIGNHDIYMRNTIEINSVKTFGEIKGVELIDELTELTVGNRKLLLVPWLANPFDSLNENKKYDCIIGHIEIKDVQMTQYGGVKALEKKGYGMSDMFKISPIVFIGHYHLKKDYKLNNGLVRALGCPLQLNWGDMGLKHGIWYFDVEKMKTEFIENKISPKHIEVLYSKFIENSLDNKELTGNYLKPVFDLPFEQKDAENFIEYINKLKPLKIDPSKFLYTITFKSQLLSESQQQLNTEECEKLVNMPLTDACMKWIEQKLGDNPNKIDLERMRSIIINSYNIVTEKRKKQEKEELK